MHFKAKSQQAQVFWNVRADCLEVFKISCCLPLPRYFCLGWKFIESDPNLLTVLIPLKHYFPENSLFITKQCQSAPSSPIPAGSSVWALHAWPPSVAPLSLPAGQQAFQTSWNSSKGLERGKASKFRYLSWKLFCATYIGVEILWPSVNSDGVNHRSVC